MSTVLPTDESVKLLAEMEQKARDRLIAVVHVNNTSFDGIVHVSRQPESEATRFAVIFSLNGKKLVVEYVEHNHKLRPEEIGPKLCELVAAKIATEVLSDAFRRFDAQQYLR